MKSLTILVDMDAILCDLNLKVIQCYNQRFGTAHTTDDIQDWGYSNFEHKEFIWGLFSEEGFFADLAPIAGAISTVEKLHNDGHDIVIVSAPSGP